MPEECYLLFTLSDKDLATRLAPRSARVSDPAVIDCRARRGSPTPPPRRKDLASLPIDRNLSDSACREALGYNAVTPAPGWSPP